ncbi:DUF1552 domain-containing protein [bacterium]|nr:DUF1552 domain-containing protein [bacterium]
MSKKPWHLDRRSFLRGLGVTCSLPFLECMTASTVSAATPPNASSSAPKRMCFLYTPNGVGLPPEENVHHEKWHWFPHQPGDDYQLNESLKPLHRHREDMSILGGLSHPNSRSVLGHAAGDTWLTGGDVRGSKYLNSISVDQLAARTLGTDTRFPSLSLSTDGGIGYKSRVSTLSFDDNGKPVPSEHRQREIFERYFAPSGKSTTASRRKSLESKRKIVDLVLEDSKRMKRQLGRTDNQKIDEYLSALNSVEEQVLRNEKWLDIPLENFDADHLNLNVDAMIDPQAYVRATLDLMVLALQTDMTRVMTYMMAREDGMGFGENFPRLALGIKKGHHGISHDKAKDHWVQWGQYDAWLASQYAYFIKRLKETKDEHGSLLDNTLVLYGSACSSTHNARNYPLVLSGGSNMGVQHGSYTQFDEEETPMSNLFVSMLNAVGAPTESFADSTGKLPAVFA